MAGRGLTSVAFALAVAVLATAGPALGATRILTADGSAAKRQAGWVRASLMPPPPGRIVVRFGACPHFDRYAGCVEIDRPRTIWMRRGLPNARAVFFHELGHVFDFTVLQPGDRAAFKRIHQRRARWWAGDEAPGEWFADAYSQCARFATIPTALTPTGYGYSASPARHAASCRLIARIGRRIEGKRPKPSPPPATPPVLPEPPPVVEQPRVRWKPYRCLAILTCYSR